MGAPIIWLLRLFVLLGFFSLTCAHPLETSLIRDDAIIRNTDQVSNDTVLTVRTDALELQKRRRLPDYTSEEQRALRNLALDIEHILQPGDRVFFVGNSGS